MKSLTTSDFWAAYRKLPRDIKERVRAAYRLWKRNPRHPSLRFKKIGQLWSIRICAGYRALAIQDGDAYVWFWIGDHDDYERMLAKFA
jgi:hypothetical protein